MFSFYPLPNRTPIDPYNNQNYYKRASQSFGRNSVNTRIDYRMGKHSIYGTGGITKDDITTPGPWGNGNPFYSYRTLLGTSVFLGQNVSDNNPYGAIGDTITLSPTVVVDLRYGVNRINATNLANVNPNFNYRPIRHPPKFDCDQPRSGSPD